MLDPKDRSIIEKWGQRINGHPRIGLSVTGDSRGALIREFCEEIKILAPRVMVSRMDDDGDAIPFIQVQKRVKFRGIPKGPDLAPFLDAVIGEKNHASQGGMLEDHIIKKIRIPVFLKVYFSSRCNFCPKVVASVFMLATRSSMIHAEIIDGELFSDLAGKDQIRSVPTVIFEDQFRWIGSVDISELVEMMINRDSSKLSSATLQKMIEEGRAADLAQMMTKSKVVYPGFIVLLTDPIWSKRLGAMAVLEYLEEGSRELAEAARVKLWEFFEPADDQVKGDIAYILGGSKDPAILSNLLAIINGPYAEDVREAAREALGTG